MLKRVFLLIIVVTVLFAIVSTNVYSFNVSVGAFSGDGKEAKKSAENMAGSVLNVVRIAAVGIGLIMLTVLATKYLLASPGDRAEIKGSAVRYILGAVLMFSAAGILLIIQSFTEKTLPNA